MPQISVIVPVYKVEPYLRRCVDSIISQTFTDFELILVDDGSPDGCPAICDEYTQKDSRIHVIHQENGGLSAARNAGIDWAFANSDSQWLTFIDSDDWVSSDYLDFLYRAAINSDVGISMCDIDNVTDDKINSSVSFSFQIMSPEQAYIPDNEWIRAFACGRLYKKDCFSLVRFPVGKLYEDLYIVYKILFTQKQVAVVTQKLYYYFRHSESITNSPWTPKKLDQEKGYSIQIPYFRDHGYSQVMEVVLRNDLMIISEQIKSIRELNEPQYKTYEKILLKMLRKRLAYAHQNKITLPNRDCLPYETAYPKLMVLYWYWNALMRKIR